MKNCTKMQIKRKKEIEKWDLYIILRKKKNGRETRI